MVLMVMLKIQIINYLNPISKTRSRLLMMSGHTYVGLAIPMVQMMSMVLWAVRITAG